MEQKIKYGAFFYGGGHENGDKPPEIGNTKIYEDGKDGGAGDMLDDSRVGKKDRYGRWVYDEVFYVVHSCNATNIDEPKIIITPPKGNSEGCVCLLEVPCYCNRLKIKKRFKFFLKHKPKKISDGNGYGKEITDNDEVIPSYENGEFKGVKRHA